jgi:hypothetical protein
MNREKEKRIAAWLRLIADHIETGKSPYIMNFDVPNRDPDKPCKNDMVETFSVTFSYPWGG